MPVYGYNLDPSKFLWLFGGAIALVAVLLDTDWKRRLFRHHGEKSP
jgi:hypothetical protein